MVGKKRPGCLTQRSVVGGLVLSLATGVGLSYLLPESKEQRGYPFHDVVLLDPSLRPLWLGQFVDVLPSYASLIYADAAVLDSVEREHQYVPPEDKHAFSFPDDESQLGRGSSTSIYICPESISPLFEQLPYPPEDLSLILRTAIGTHELLHAQHFFSSPDAYPVEHFFDDGGVFNRRLFMNVSELLCYHAEYDALGEQLHGSDLPFVEQYRSELPHRSVVYYEDLLHSGKGMDPAFMRSLFQDLYPSDW